MVLEIGILDEGMRQNRKILGAPPQPRWGGGLPLPTYPQLQLIAPAAPRPTLASKIAGSIKNRYFDSFPDGERSRPWCVSQN